MKLRIALLLLLVSVVYLTYRAVVTGGFGWDLDVIEWVQAGVHEDYLGPLPDILFWMGLKGVAGVSIVLLSLWLWFKGWRAEAFFTTLVIIPDFLNIFVRDIIGRPRPTADMVSNVLGGPQGYSFPSGYALHVTLFCGFLIFLAWRLMRPGPRRWVTVVLLGLYIPVTGLWLLYDGRHWPSDVLGGYLYGLCYLVVIVWCYRKYVSWRRRYPARSMPREQLPAMARPFARILTAIS